jgi:hypothetical protein
VCVHKSYFSSFSPAPELPEVDPAMLLDDETIPVPTTVTADYSIVVIGFFWLFP